MASLTGTRFLFFTTSPRSPMKIIPEIELLRENFSGKKWNSNTQASFMDDLLQSDFFEGVGAKDKSFAARDRINRAPKALGFVDLTPNIKITDAGNALIDSNLKEEVLLRQLLKFQLPSPYHTKSSRETNIFKVKPYLEMFRLINYFGKLSFDEVMMFGLQLTDYNRFDEVVEKIEQFRIEKAKTTSSYRQFRGEYLKEVVIEIFNEEIESANTKLRESDDDSLKNFVKTKSRTMRDYTDACFRYLRATGMVNISQKGRSLSIVEEKREEIEFILETVDREPVFVDKEKEYKKYLFDINQPVLYTDDIHNIVFQIQKLDRSVTAESLYKLSLFELKENLYLLRGDRQKELVDEEVKLIKQYKKYDEIVELYDDIRNKDVYDLPLMFEWNTWRAMTMLNGGKVFANLKFDDNGVPMSTAQGNMADIVCDYGDFGLTVEVTLSSGQRQYEMEGEPVARHLAKYKKETSKDAYCLFIAPTINDASISHFFTLHNLNIEFYGGKSVIVPLELNVFIKMVEDSYKADYTPTLDNVKSLFEYSKKVSKTAENEKDWFNKVKDKALNWLA